jgi:hypothetical protein
MFLCGAVDLGTKLRKILSGVNLTQIINGFRISWWFRVNVDPTTGYLRHVDLGLCCQSSDAV